MYQVLYRKYRPKVFDDVVGQEHITSTLQSEIINNKLSHAYLFTGSRGTGKTSCAKILSKAVNCLHPVNGNPCNECEICKGIDSGAILDVTEIDAASNNGVENIREIRDESSFAPAACKYRVYIIDEVHMLSIGAFNALLKTLEEPPEHVKFILATTEIHKLPVTILSRCQRFDFKRVSAESMKIRMDKIAELEGFHIDDEATKLISRLSDGGMRDALSMLDRCIGKSDNVTVDVVSEIAGLTGKEHLFSIADAIAKKDTATALDVINELYLNSFDMERLCSELINHFRSLMIVKTVKNADNVLVSTNEEIEEYKDQSKRFTLRNLLISVDALQSALANIKRGVNRRTELELSVIKLCTPTSDIDFADVIDRIENIERKIQNGVSFNNVKSVPEQIVQSTESKKSNEKNTNDNKAVHPVPKQGNVTDGEFKQWQNVLKYLSKENKPLWGNLVGTTAYVKDGTLVIRSATSQLLTAMLKRDQNNKDLLIASHDVTGIPIRKTAVVQWDESFDILPSIKQEEIKQNENEPETSKLDAFLNKAQELGIGIEIN